MDLEVSQDPCNTTFVHSSRSFFIVMTLTPEQLNDLIDKYCDRVVGELDIKSMEQMLYEMLVGSFGESNENDMKELICAIYDEEYWQELVESVTAD